MAVLIVDHSLNISQSMKLGSSYPSLEAQAGTAGWRGVECRLGMQIMTNQM